MPRPCKRRRICAIPGCLRFGPVERPEVPKSINLTLDEYETIRLIDAEGLTQAECALQMGVARTTVQAIYGNARRKLAQSLTEGADLHISGGDYEVCSRPAGGCGHGRCHHRKK